MNNLNKDLVGPDSWPTARLAWGAVTILAVAQFVNALDRYLINLLVEPIKADLQISDTQIGLLLGFAFAIFYTVMGLPIGRWADTYSRRFLITCGAGFWSLMTMACGLAGSFKQLFLTRMAVGAGEASLNPCAYSLISDYFPAERRATPMGVFIMGATIGSAAVLFLGGHLIEYLTENNITWALPWGGYLKPWQIAFVIAGMPGFLVMLLIQLIREPPRRELIESHAGREQQTRKPKPLPVRDVVAYVTTHARSYAPIFLGFGMVLMWAMGKNLWAPTFMLRTFGWSPSQVGLAMALIMLFGNSLGVVAGGRASEWVSKRGYRDAHLRTAFYGTLIGLPFAVTATLVSNPIVSVTLLFPAFFFGSFPFSLAPAAIASITPNQMRGQITAFYLLTVNLLGYGLGPALIGALTDHVFEDTHLLGRSMSTAAALAMPIALVLLWSGMRTYLRTIDELAAHTARYGGVAAPRFARAAGRGLYSWRVDDMGPLAGIKVIELAGIGPAPFGAMLLADLGADVVRVERASAKPHDPLPVDCLLRNRRSIALNFKKPEAVEILLKLVESADVLIEGYRPGVTERLGVGPDVCLARNPKLVYGRMTGWGQNGPLAKVAGHDINYIALSGALHMIGTAGGKPVPPLNLVGDFGGGGMMLAFGVLAAVLEARRSGRGQVVDAAMLDGSIAMMGIFFAMNTQGVVRDATGEEPLAGGAPWYDTYRTKDGRYVAVGAIEPQFYTLLLEKLGLDVKRFAPLGHPAIGDEARRAWPELRAAMTSAFASRTREEWCSILEGIDACFSPVLSLAEAPHHPHNVARGTFIEVDGVPQNAPAPRFSRTPSGKVRRPPRAGENTEAVLAKAGYSSADIERLRAAGVLT